MTKIEIIIEATGKTPNIAPEAISGERQPTNDEYRILQETFGIDFRRMEQPEVFLSDREKSMIETLDRMDLMIKELNGGA